LFSAQRSDQPRKPFGVRHTFTVNKNTKPLPYARFFAAFVPDNRQDAAVLEHVD